MPKDSNYWPFLASSRCKKLRTSQGASLRTPQGTMVFHFGGLAVWLDGQVWYEPSALRF